MPGKAPTIEDLRQSSYDDFEISSGEHQAHVQALATSIVESGHGIATLEKELGNPDNSIEFTLALFLAISRLQVLRLEDKLKVAVVFAMWGEQNRLRPRSESNPNGEDLLRTKIDQLAWCTQGTDVTTRIYAVDDGCPHGSGTIAQEIVEASSLQDQVEVLHLQDALPTSEGPLRELKSANDSRKAGAIILGCMQALKDGYDAILYTDADNSVNLGQIGLLLGHYQRKECPVVMGNRKHPRALLVKQEDRWGVGIKLLRHMQRMVGNAIFSQGILDTQAAFKLYDRQVLEEILKKPSVFDFSFDSDWLAAILAKKIPFKTVPFAFIDSFEESASIAQGPMTTWVMLLLGLVKSIRKRGLPHNHEMATVLDNQIKSSEDLDLLIDSLPPQLESVTDAQLGDPEIMSPEEIRDWIVARKSLIR